MKKIFSIMMMTLMMFMVASSASAQTAVQTAKAFDNVYVGAQVGARTPLTFNSTFPIDATASLRIGKDFTPVVGAFIEGTAIFGDNVGWGHSSCISKTFVRGISVGLNGTVNLSNLFGGYNGAPRTIELITVTGLGWGHIMDTSDDLVAKTGVDIAFNLGKAKAWQIYAEPAVYWNLTGNANSKVQFNKQFAQLGVSLGVNYKFMTSNGTHNFKLYDVGEMNDRINRLIAENEELKNRVPTVIEKTTTVIKEVNVDKTIKVSFDQNSDELSDGAKAALDRVAKGSSVSIIGTASPEGTVARNTVLSENRAKVVADYLSSRGVNVVSARGSDAGRTAIVTVE